MKIITSLIVLLAALAVQAQDLSSYYRDTAKGTIMALDIGQLPAPPTTNAPPTIQQDLQDIFNQAISTNWYFALYYLHAPGLLHKEGGGIAALTPLSTYVLTGIRVDYVDGNFWMPSGQATLQLPITPISSWKWLTFTPFGFVGVGVPVSGATVSGVVIPGHPPKDNNGQPTAILGLGASISIWKNSSSTSKFKSIEIVGDKETWTGFAGQQYRIGLAGHITF